MCRAVFIIVGVLKSNNDAVVLVWKQSGIVLGDYRQSNNTEYNRLSLKASGCLVGKAALSGAVNAH